MLFSSIEVYLANKIVVFGYFKNKKIGHKLAKNENLGLYVYVYTSVCVLSFVSYLLVCSTLPPPHPSPAICFYIQHFGIRVRSNKVLGQYFPALNTIVYIYNNVFIHSVKNRLGPHYWEIGNAPQPYMSLAFPGGRHCANSTAHISHYCSSVSSAARSLSAPH